MGLALTILAIEWQEENPKINNIANLLEDTIETAKDKQTQVKPLKFKMKSGQT